MQTLDGKGSTGCGNSDSTSQHYLPLLPGKFCDTLLKARGSLNWTFIPYWTSCIQLKELTCVSYTKLNTSYTPLNSQPTTADRNNFNQRLSTKRSVVHGYVI